MTTLDSGKVDELNDYPEVNLAYYKDGTREFVSVSGRATVTKDPAMIRELYEPDWKAWLGDEGGERGTPPKAGDLGHLERRDLASGQGRT